MARRVILGFASFALLGTAEVPDADVLLRDDECAAGDEACALNALQLRKGQQTATEEAGAAAGEAGTAKWYLGAMGASCTDVCRKYSSTCSAADFSQIRDLFSVSNAATQAGSRCSMSWANDYKHGAQYSNIPAVCVQSQCGVDPQGLCAYDSRGAGSCDGQPPIGFARLCPCVSGGSGYYPAGGSATGGSGYYPGGGGATGGSGYYPGGGSATGGSGYYPGGGSATGGSGYYPGGPSPAPGPSTACEINTLGTCKLMACDKSRGVGVTCSKDYKCVCKPGYCAVKGVCVDQQKYQR